jgi:hypothetical protein
MVVICNANLAQGCHDSHVATKITHAVERIQRHQYDRIYLFVN